MEKKLSEKVSKLEIRITALKDGKVELQAQCEKLHETTRQLHGDNKDRQSHIQELNKTKADKQMVDQSTETCFGKQSEPSAV